MGRDRVVRTSLALLIALSVGGAAAAQTSAPPDAPPPNPANVQDKTVAVPASGLATPVNPDPWEPVNRKLFGVYQVLDRDAIRPAAVFYKRATPRPIRTGLRNAFRNLGEPVIFLNDVLQVRVKDAGATLGRFTLNSTVGLAGLFDPASGAGLAYHANGFGTTLGRYGTPAGPYIFIPVLGPSDVRDAIGSGIDALTDPLTWIQYPGRVGVGVSRTVIGGLDTRANADSQLKIINETATDPYASIRSLYLQNRQAEITGGQVDLNALPSFGDEPTTAPNAAGEPGAAPAPVGGPAPSGAAGALPSQSPPTTTPSQP